MKNKNSQIFLILILCFLLFYSSSIAWATTMFSHTFGGIGGDYARSVIETTDGGFIIGGYTNSFRTLGTTNYDSWLIKTDISGNVIWNKTYGQGILRSLIETTDNNIVFVGNHRILKIDHEGNLVWNRTYDGAVFNSITESSDGGFAIGGDIYSADNGSHDFLLIKTDHNGNLVWNKTFDNGVTENAYSIIETSDRGFAIVGVTSYHNFPEDVGFSDCWLVKTDMNGVVEWNQTYGGQDFVRANSLIQTSDDGYLIVGQKTLEHDGWLVKTDSKGNLVLTKTFGKEYHDEQIFEVIETVDGGVAFVGQSSFLSEGRADFWLVKLDSSFNEEWNQTYGGSGMDMAYSFVESENGGYVLVGDTYSIGLGDSDFWFVKTDDRGVIPEFSSWIVIPLFLIVSFVVTVYKKRMKK